MVILYANRRRLVKLVSQRLPAVTPLPSSTMHNNNGVSVEEGGDLSLGPFTLLESFNLAAPLPSPFNSSEEGSYYSSLPDVSSQTSSEVDVLSEGSLESDSEYDDIVHDDNISDHISIEVPFSDEV